MQFILSDSSGTSIIGNDFIVPDNYRDISDNVIKLTIIKLSPPVGGCRRWIAPKNLCRIRQLFLLPLNLKEIVLRYSCLSEWIRGKASIFKLGAKIA